MKKIFVVLALIFSIIPSFAQKYPDLKQKEIKYKNSISYNESNNVWSYKVNKKNDLYYTKVKGFGSFYDYVDSKKDFAFTTDCEYEFISNGTLFGFSNRDLKFYEITYLNGGLSKRPLTKEEVQLLLPDYKIIATSEFSDKTNAIKIKKSFGNLKLLIYNDSEDKFDNYKFTSGNASFESYDLRGFITVSKAGMIEFSANNNTNENSRWYVILVR